MGQTAAGLLTVAALVGVLALVWAPFGDYMARVLTDERHLRAERVVYRVVGVDPDNHQSTRGYVLSVLGLGVVGVVVLVAVLRLQAFLPFDRDLPAMPWDMAFNTAVSFVTNTNWQSYTGESTLGWAAQAGGLAVQNFVSAAMGIAVAAALVRGVTRTRDDDLGNFWVDLTRVVVRILLPVTLVAAVVLVALGAVQSFAGDTVVGTITGGQQTITTGPVASQEAVKLLGTNGGGFFNANSAHPYENPTAVSNLLEIFLLLVIPVCLTRTFGTMIGSRRHGYALAGVVATLWSAALAVALVAETNGWGDSARAAGAAMEGKETRFGTWASTLFAVSTTGTSTGAVNASHDSLTPASGGVAIVNMMLGEVSPGGVGSGLYGLLVMAVLAVFVSGLMVGRTPEILGKKVCQREMTYVALYVLSVPAALLVGLGVAIALPGTPDAMGNPGGHGFSEVVYAYASAANNNGSAFGGLTVTSSFFQVSLAVVMLVGRFVPIVLVLLLAGSLARQRTVPASAGTLPTHTPLFAGLVVGVILLVTGLTFFPALSLGPVAEALS